MHERTLPIESNLRYPGEQESDTGQYKVQPKCTESQQHPILIPLYLLGIMDSFRIA